MTRRHNPFVRGLFDSVEEFVEALREPEIDVGYAASMDEALGTVAHYRGSVRPHRDQGTTGASRKAGRSTGLLPGFGI